MEDGGNVMEGMVTDIETQHQTNVEHYLEVFQQWRNKNSRPYTMVYYVLKAPIVQECS